MIALRINIRGCDICASPEGRHRLDLALDVGGYGVNVDRGDPINRAMLRSMSADDLWQLHEMLCEIVIEKMQEEKAELERKLIYLNRQHSEDTDVNADHSAPAGKPTSPAKT